MIRPRWNEMCVSRMDSPNAATAYAQVTTGRLAGTGPRSEQGVWSTMRLTLALSGGRSGSVLAATAAFVAVVLNGGPR
jgi:hypothetical protein